MPATTENPYFAADADLVYETTRWQRFLWNEREGASESMRGAVRNIGSTVYESRRDRVASEERPAYLDGLHNEANSFAAETFARLYADPGKLDAPASDWASVAHGILDQLPEWDALRAAVEGDPDFAALATREVVDAVAAKLPPVLDKLNEQNDNDCDDNDGQPSDGGSPQGGQGQGQGQGDGPDLGATESALRSALRRAVKAATDKAMEGKRALAGLAPGLEAAPATHEQADPARMVLAERLLADDRLREVLRRAGALRRIAATDARKKDPEGGTEVIGVEHGADIPLILPSELAVLGDPDLEILLLKDLVEGACLQYRVEDTQPLGRGPIVVLCDESGSMEGESNVWAKSAVIAALSQGLREKREVAIAMFNRRITNAWVQDSAGKVVAANRADATQPGSPWGKSHELMLELCQRGAGGGTEFDAPLTWALDRIGTQGRADIVLVTDGHANPGEAILERVSDAQGRGLRVYGLTVGGGSLSPAVEALCTEAVDIDAIADEDIPTRLAATVPVRRRP